MIYCEERNFDLLFWTSHIYLKKNNSSIFAQKLSEIAKYFHHHGWSCISSSQLLWLFQCQNWTMSWTYFKRWALMFHLTFEMFDQFQNLTSLQFMNWNKMHCEANFHSELFLVCWWIKDMNNVMSISLNTGNWDKKITERNTRPTAFNSHCYSTESLSCTMLTKADPSS